MLSLDMVQATPCVLRRHLLCKKTPAAQPGEFSHYISKGFSRPYCSQKGRRQPDLHCRCTFVALADTLAAQTRDPSAFGLLHSCCCLHTIGNIITIIQLNQGVKVCHQSSSNAQQQKTSCEDHAWRLHAIAGDPAKVYVRVQADSKQLNCTSLCLHCRPCKVDASSCAAIQG